MMNKDYQKLVHQCDEHFKSSLQKRFGSDWIIYNFDTYQKISIPDLLQIKNIIVTEPCLGELKELQDKGHQGFWTPSRHLGLYLRDLGVEFFELPPLKLKLKASKKARTIGFRGPDHPMGGFEVFVGMMSYLAPSLGVQVDFTPSQAASLAYNNRFSSYYDPRRHTINWPKYRDSLLRKIKPGATHQPDLIIVPGYNFNVGYDYFLESFGISGGQIFMAQNCIHDEVKAHHFSTQIFSNYKLGDMDSVVNQQIYQILAEEVRTICKI